MDGPEGSKEERSHSIADHDRQDILNLDLNGIGFGKYTHWLTQLNTIIAIPH